MRSERVSESQRIAANKYDAKTYKRITIAMRLEDDADIIKDIEDAQGAGLSLRMWLRGIYDKANKER